MKKTSVLVILVLVAAVLSIAGCEQKVIENSPRQVPVSNF